MRAQRDEKESDCKLKNNIKQNNKKVGRESNAEWVKMIRIEGKSEELNCVSSRICSQRIKIDAREDGKKWNKDRLWLFVFHKACLLAA